MIILSGVLVVVAIALLVAGIVAGNGDSAQVFGLDALVVIYISIAVSIISALCLAIGVFLRRKELWGAAASAAPARQSKQSKKSRKDRRKRPAPPAPAPAKSAAGAPAAASAAAAQGDAADDGPEVPAPPADVPEGALVFVVRGRKRYHLDTCRQLAGRDVEELTYAEAKEEGFSPCTACMPDTALAARAAASVPAPAGKSGGTAGREPGAERSEGGLAGLAKPASSAAPTSFDTPVSFADPGKPASSDEPGAFDKPGAFDRTAEIPRADESAAEPPASPAGPTLTDVPAASLFGAAAAEAPSAPETPEKAESAPKEPEARSGWERPAEPASADPGATVDLGSAPLAGGEAAAKPGRTDDEPGAESGAESSADDAFAASEPEPSGADEPSGEPDDEGPQVRILSGTKRYHRVDCALIEDVGDDADDLESLSRAEAKSRGCTPCLVCQPDRAHARD